jgi:CheY-like chemotaxis protein
MRTLRSVLCVDDDDDICEVVKATLSLIAGLDVVTVGTGEEMITVAHALRPDLVLMDIMMPGLDGPSTIERMRANTMIESIPFIFLTAKVMPSELAHVLKLGALGVIAKPFDPLKLGEQVLALWRRADSAATFAGVPATPAAETASALLVEQMDSVAGRFRERAGQDVVVLRKLIAQAKRGDLAALGQVEYIGHSISGAGAMLGYSKMSAVGERIERVAGRILRNPEASRTGDLASFQELMDCIDRLAKEVKTVTRRPPADTGLSQLSRSPGSVVVKSSSYRYRRVAARGRKSCPD